MIFNAFVDWTLVDRVTGNLSLTDLGFCHLVCTTDILQIGLLQKISKNPGRTPNGCAQWVYIH
jgi:hypothetical protein